MEKTGITYPILWVESGLHNVPRKLNRRLQEVIEEAENAGAERILMGFGFCGNSMVGLHAHTAEIILPRIDDCISLLLGSQTKRKQIEKENGGTYFMTKGWIDGERNIMVEYEYTMKKYGEEDGKEIFDMMFGNYKQIGILDTGCYPMQPVEAETQRMAGLLNLTWKTHPASNQYLKDLLNGPWLENRFLRFSPGGRYFSRQSDDSGIKNGNFCFLEAGYALISQWRKWKRRYNRDGYEMFRHECEKETAK